VKIDLKTLEGAVAAVARQDYGLRRRVCSNGPPRRCRPRRSTPSPRAGACEIIHPRHQFPETWSTSTRQFPADLFKAGDVTPWVRANADRGRPQAEKDTEEQFIYKARKKAIGPFTTEGVGLVPKGRRGGAKSAQTLEEQFTFLMTKPEDQRPTGGGGGEVSSRCRRSRSTAPPRDCRAAGGTITARRGKKAEGAR